MIRTLASSLVLVAAIAAIAAPTASAAGTGHGAAKVSLQDINFAQPTQPGTSSEGFRGGVRVAVGDLNGDAGASYSRVRFGDLVISS